MNSYEFTKNPAASSRLLFWIISHQIYFPVRHISGTKKPPFFGGEEEEGGASQKRLLDTTLHYYVVGDRKPKTWHL